MPGIIRNGQCHKIGSSPGTSEYKSRNEENTSYLIPHGLNKLKQHYVVIIFFLWDLYLDVYNVRKLYGEKESISNQGCVFALIITTLMQPTEPHPLKTNQRVKRDYKCPESQKEGLQFIHFPFDFLFFYSDHKRKERRKNRGRSQAVRERLYVLTLLLIIIIIMAIASSSLCTSCLFLSIITHCSLARWSTINKQKIASQRRRRTNSPWLCWSYSNPIKTNRFFPINRETECVCRLGRDAELYLCVPANRSSVISEYMNDGNGRDIFQRWLPTRFIAPHVPQRGLPVLHSEAAKSESRGPNRTLQGCKLKVMWCVFCVRQSKPKLNTILYIRIEHTVNQKDATFPPKMISDGFFRVKCKY